MLERPAPRGDPCEDDYVEEVLRQLDPRARRHDPRPKGYESWLESVEALGSVLHRAAFRANLGLSIADDYGSMAEFWSEVERTEAGLSSGTYWDTYEHGLRRQIERKLAAGYGAGSAILLNSGMSAVAVSLGSCSLRHTGRILTSERHYFETDGFLRRFVEPLGVEVVRRDLSAPGALDEAIRRLRPEVVLLETVANCPTLDTAHGLRRAITEFPATTFIVDNSAQSWLTRWFDLTSRSDNLLVIESGTKYITNDAMCGVLYGCGERIGNARVYARDTGQQMQGRALSYLQDALLTRLHGRLRLHSRNAIAFRDLLRETLPQHYSVETLDSTSGGDPDGIFRDGVGAMVFIRRIDGTAMPEGIIERWRDVVAGQPQSMWPQIRAGFGWLRTSARAYVGAALNQADAPNYVRVSLGVEPVDAVLGSGAVFADLLNAAS